MTNGSAHFEGFDGDVFEAQRQLRMSLLDRPAIASRNARDLAAHMLLSIDDLESCWSVATSWLRDELGCHRVDTGFGSANARDYLPGFAEAKNANFDVPSFGGGTVFNKDPAMQAMWLGTRPVVFADIKQDSRVTAYLRNRIAGAKTKSKFGGALRSKSGSFGLVCADWTEHLAPNESDLYDCFESTVRDVLGPIIAVSREISRTTKSADDTAKDSRQLAEHAADDSSEQLLNGLTTSETEVAKFVAQGLSYKEIARIRGRSVSTIDHQLRSIRQKTGVSSTAGLVSLFSKVQAFRQ